MRILIAVAAVFALGAAAQEPVAARRVMVGPINVMGQAVKGAPYSADEITESLQVLADGTRISSQNQVAVYRDGEGRVRRESPTEISIWDPVAKVGYTLNPKTMTATKSTMSMTYSFVTSAGPQRFSFTYTGGSASAAGTPTASADLDAAKQQAEYKAVLIGASLDKLKAELAASEDGAMVVNGNPANPQTVAVMKKKLDVASQTVSQGGVAGSFKAEPLGQQLMQGVTAEGTRSTTTIEAGAIGNDRPIQVVSERWYSAELQTVVLTKRNDPRTGEETFRLANVHRGEPGADLFLLPPGYQLTEQPGKVMMPRSTGKEE